jgi:hypothetical protein
MTHGIDSRATEKRAEMDETTAFRMETLRHPPFCKTGTAVTAQPEKM